MPEYFAEANVRFGNIQSFKPGVSDVKEVWFASSHSNVYVTYLPLRSTCLTHSWDQLATC